MIGLEEGGDGWTQPHVVMLFAISAVGLAVFIAVERRATEPMIPLHLFANPVVLACLVAGMCAGTIAFGAGQFLPLYFQDSLFVSPTESGLRMLPQMLGVTIGTFGIGRLILWTGRYKIFPVVGTAVAAGGLFAIGHITGTTPYPWLVGPMIAMGFGIAAVFTTTSIATQNAVEFHDLGVATATIMFFRTLGGSVGLAAFGTILNATVRAEIPDRLGVNPDDAAGLIREPAEIEALPAASRAAVVDSSGARRGAHLPRVRSRDGRRLRRLRAAARTAAAATSGHLRRPRGAGCHRDLIPAHLSPAEIGSSCSHRDHVAFRSPPDHRSRHSRSSPVPPSDSELPAPRSTQTPKAGEQGSVIGPNRRSRTRSAGISPSISDGCQLVSVCLRCERRRTRCPLDRASTVPHVYGAPLTDVDASCPEGDEALDLRLTVAGAGVGAGEIVGIDDDMVEVHRHSLILLQRCPVCDRAGVLGHTLGCQPGYWTSEAVALVGSRPTVASAALHRSSVRLALSGSPTLRWPRATKA